MPNDYFVPGQDSLDYFVQKRRMAPPPLSTPKPTLTQLPPMIGAAPETQPPPLPQVPTADQSQLPPAPLKPLSRADQLGQIQARRPAPLTGPARYGQALLRGGLPGVLSAALDRKGPDRENWANERQDFMDRASLEHQQKQEDLTELQKRAYAQSIDDRSQAMKDMAADRDESREQRYVAEGLMPVAPGELQEMPEDGKPPRYEYVNVGGKMRKRLTGYAQTADKQAAEQASWPEVTPELAAEFPKSLKPGQKLPPAQYEQYTRMLETRAANHDKGLDAQIAERTKAADQLKLNGRDRQVYIATGHIERPASVSVNLGADGLSDAAIEQSAQRYLQTGELPPMGMGSAGAVLRTKILNRAAAIDPSANVSGNKAEYGASKTTLTQLQKQRGQILAFENTASKNLDVALEASDKVDRFGSPLVNKYVLWTKGQVQGDADTAKLNNAVTTAANEYAKVISGQTSGATTDSARKEAEEMLKASLSKGTFKQVVAQMKREMENRRSGFDAQIEETRKGFAGNRTASKEEPSGEVEEWVRDSSGRLVKRPRKLSAPGGK